jgi:signal transduction histidine kinase/CheY-like chemotaxis protein
VTTQGEVRWVSVLAAPLRGAAGELLGYVGTVKDVTERKQGDEERRRLERKLQEAQKLESLGVLAGGVAHDFNNLLTAIIGYVSLARQQAPGDAAAGDLLDWAVESAQRAAELCRQMLAYSGRGRFVVGRLDLSRAVRDLGALLKTSVSRKAVLAFDLADDLPRVLADASQMRQVLLNLVLNASEALGEREGVVTVRTGRAWCDRVYLRHTTLDDDLPEGEYVFVEVADTGCGMDAEMRRRVFEPFFTTKFTGRGLGLAAVLGIVRGHHGAIHLTSAPGLGTTVRVLFPPAAEEEAPPEEEAAAATGGLVLFVDDEPALRDLAERALRLAGFQVLTAADGREALEAFRGRADEVRVVVLDLTMPHLNGDEVLGELRRLRPGVRVILSSGFSEQQVIQRLPADDLNCFLQKPYRPQELVEKVRQALS